MAERISTPIGNPPAGLYSSDSRLHSVQADERWGQYFQERLKTWRRQQRDQDGESFAQKLAHSGQDDKQPGSRQSERGDDEAGVVIAHSTEVLGEDLAIFIHRAGETVRLLATRLLGVNEAPVSFLVGEFADIALTMIHKALAEFSRTHGGDETMPVALVFQDARIEVDRSGLGFSVSIGGADFVEVIDFRASGVVFDLHGSAAFHEAEAGLFIDTGIHGAAMADRLIETVRRDLLDFGDGAATADITVLVRADDSRYADVGQVGGVLDFDITIPFHQASASMAEDPGETSMVPRRVHIDVET